MGLRVTMRMGQTGRYLERRRAVFPLVNQSTGLFYIAIFTKGEHLPGGQDENGTGVQFETGADSSHGNRLDNVSRPGSKITQLIEEVGVGDGHFGEQAGLVHHTNGLAGVGTLGGLTRQHDTVRTVQDGVSNVRHLGTSGTRVICHGLEHLSGANDGLALDVTLGDHHLLGDEDLGSGDLDTQVTTGDHDTVGLLKDLVEVVDTLLVLDLGDNLNLLTLLAHDFTDVTDIATATDKRSKDHVDLVPDTKLQVADVLLGQSREINVGARQVNALTGRDVTVVQTLATQGLLVYDLEHLERKDTIIDIDQLARSDHLGDVLVVEVPVRLSAVIGLV